MTDLSVVQQLHLPPFELQQVNERRFNRKHIDGYIRKEIEDSPEIMARVDQGVALLNQWMDQDYYESKQARINQLRCLELSSMVMDVFVGIAYVGQREELFTSVSAQLAGRLGFSEKADGIRTMAEILAVLCQTDVFDIMKASRSASLMIRSNIVLSEQVQEFVANSCFLPPMVCEPRWLENNRSSGYLTHNNDSLILGGGHNHHDGNICLDVLNIQNQTALKLDIEFLSTFEEQPTHNLDVVKDIEGKTQLQIQEEIRQQKDQWMAYKRQSYYFYTLLAKQGNKLWLTHKVDKRGRIYAVGYHISTQGSAFKKAMLELCEEEIVTGVPT